MLAGHIRSSQSMPLIRHLVAALAPLLMAYALPVAAQSQPRAASDDAPEAATLDTVIVTARRREEDAAQVPIAISVLDARALDNLRIDDTASLFRQFPGLSLTSFDDGRFAYFQLRGIGPLSQALSPDDGSVVTYVDGVPQPVYASEFAYLDLERIELLRGPQGTLFGRNSQGGALNLVTRKPSQAREASARLEVGRDGYALGQVALSGPLSADRVAAGVSARYSSFDGFVDNLAPQGGQLGDRESAAVRGSAVITPAGEDGAIITLVASADHQRSQPFYYVRRGGPLAVELDPTNNSDRRTWGASAHVELPLAWGVLHSITALNGFANDQVTDDTDGLIYGPLFGLPTEAFLAPTDFSDWREEERRGYQELRVDSLPTAAFDWTLGAVYFRSDFDVLLINRSSFSPFLNGDRDALQEIRSKAVFGEATFALGNPRLRATLGLRHTRDDKTLRADFTGTGFPGTVARFSETGHRRDDLLTGRAALSWSIDDDTLAYASVGRGAKSGGFPRFTLNAAFGLPTRTYEDSTSWTYEAGLKSLALDGRARFSLAAFYNDVADEQLLTLDFVSFQFFPANLDTRSHGLEAEAQWALSQRWRLGAAAAWTRAEVAEAGASGAQRGNRVPNVARFMGNALLAYEGERRMGGGQPVASLSHQYVGRRAADVGNSFDLDGYHNVDARAGLRWPSVELYLFTRNLGDRQPQINGALYGPGVEGASYGRGRQLGLGASWRF